MNDNEPIIIIYIVFWIEITNVMISALHIMALGWLTIIRQADIK